MSKDWIQKADLDDGALTATAKRAGAVHKSGVHKGKIKVDWLKEQAKKNTITGKRARLAMTFRKMGRK